MWRQWNRRPRISYTDADYVRDHIQTPATFAKFCTDRISVHYVGKQAKDIDLVGTEPTYFDIKQLRDHGRACVHAAGSPERSSRPGHRQRAREKLLPGVDPLGKSITIGGLPYRVIGVVAKQGTLFGISLDKFAIMPFNAPARRLICPINILDDLHVQTADPASMRAAMGEAEAAMRSRRQLKPGRRATSPCRRPRRAEGLEEDLAGPLPGAAWPGGDLARRRRHRHHEHHADGGERADPRDRHSQGARRAASRHPGPVRRRIGHALHCRARSRGIGTGLALAWIVAHVTPLPAAVAPWSIAGRCGPRYLGRQWSPASTRQAAPLASIRFSR